MPLVRQEYILEAIDQLRRRKARPDLNRISNYIFRRYSASCKDTASTLEKLVEAQVVVKVDYKGCTSYRNAAKWSMFSYYKNKQEHDFVTTLVCRSVAELILMEPKYLDQGVPYDILVKHVSRRDKRFSKQHFNYILESELDNGSLIRLSNGNYFVGELKNHCEESQSLAPNGSPSTSNASSASASNDKSSKSLISAPVPAKKLRSKLALTRRKKRANKKSQLGAGKGLMKDLQNENKSVMDDEHSMKDVPDCSASTAEKVATGESPQCTADDETTSEPLSETSYQVEENLETVNISDCIGVTDSFKGDDAKDDPDWPEEAPSEIVKEPSTSKRVDLVDLNLSGRRKRSKKIVFDPSDNNLPRVKRGKKGKPLPLPSPKVSPPGSKQNSPNKHARKSSCDSIERVKRSDPTNSTSIFQPVCGICDCSEKRVKGVLDSLISCTDCITKVHLKCFESTKAPGPSLKVDVNNWQCSNCKTCSVCEDSAEVDKLLICYACDEAFHAVCHDTISNCKTKVSKDNDKWICRSCFLASQIELVEESMKQRAEAFPTAKVEPVYQSQSLNGSCANSDSESVDAREPISATSVFRDPYEGHPIDESVPDAREWSTEDVYKYFTKYFQPPIPEIFKRQEIDGLSLLLLNRCDILSGFNLKLGPALKVYGHVKRLQIRRTAPQLLWL